MRDSETVEEFYNHTILILNQLRLNGESIEDKKVEENILRSLARKFEYIVVAIKESKDLDFMSLENLLGILQSHELRMRQFDISPFEQAFQLHSADGQERGKTFDINQQHDNKERFKGRNTTPVKCRYCQKFGHIAKYSRKRIAEERGSTFLNIEANNEDDSMFMILNTQEVSTVDTWYIDSGCSNHMTNNKGLFTQLDETQKREVRTGDDKRLIVQGIGEISIDTKLGHKKISNVYFVPNLKHSLLSVGQLLQRRYDVHFRNNTCEIRDPNGILLARVNMTTNKMFSLNFKGDTLFSFNMSTKQNSLFGI
ncbi:uncharacterized protein LOC112505964 [Cynara cardunculus var. scolymus]|uniref:uncharacterized protein LOC112505964 n=1 Tax=Cynara cardunculus var. scolymus TaxID=59895 RepID=UPI000D630D36|nr:uncharacterized protein LOC112505964 [Cynara cardunculus var. scolymus]